MITAALTLALMLAVVFAAGRWAEVKQRRLAIPMAAEDHEEVADARPDR